MHTATTANETLDFLWKNYLTLCEQVDLDVMPPEALDAHIQHNSPVRPFRIAAWLTRQGFFIAAWSLWEYYSRSVCQRLPIKEKKADKESTVNWVGRSLASNKIDFADKDWFVSANALRNLIAHSGARADGSRAEALLRRSRTAFPDIDTWQDGYVNLTHYHVAKLQIKIENIIRKTAYQDAAPNGATYNGIRDE